MRLADQQLNQGNAFFCKRSFIPLILFPFAFIITKQSVFQHPDWFQHSIINLPEIACLVLCGLGLAIRIVTVGFTPANTSGRNTATQVADELNTTGIYSIVRHPLYLGNYFMWLGIAVLSANAMFLIVFSLLYFIFYERIMLAEEDFLASKFGDTYIQWSQQAPTIVPSPSLWKSCELHFSWKKVLAKEKNGILAVFTLLAVFQLWVDFVQTGTFKIPHGWTLLGLGLTSLLYLVLKVLKYNTQLLNEKNR